MHLGLKAKLIAGFSVIFLIGFILGIFGLFSINKIAAMSETQTKIQSVDSDVSDVLAAHYVWRQNLTIAVLTDTEFTGSFDPDNCALGKWRNSVDAEEITDDEVKSLLTQLDEPHKYIHTQAEVVMNMMNDGKVYAAQKIFINDILPKANDAITYLTQIKARYNTLLEDQTQAINDFQAGALSAIVVMLIVSLILGVVLSIIICKSIMNPLVRLAESANMVTTGNFGVNFEYHVNDEIGKLTHSLATLVDTFRTILDDINTMAENQAAGDTEYYIDSSRYSGEFQAVTTSVNEMMKTDAAVMIKTLQVVEKYADGDFSVRLEPLPGKKAMSNNILDAVADNLQEVKKSVLFLTNSTIAGELDKRADDSRFKGDWKAIVSGMNQLIETVNAPLVEAQKALSLVSEGRLDVKVTGRYKGQFANLADSINRTIDILSVYILDISTTLNEMASDNFNISVDKEYLGNFSDIKVSLNAIINRLNNVVGEIGMAAEQVSSGAAQVSESSITLAQGATEQASEVQQLNATLDEIQAQTVKNSENSTVAHRLSTTAKESAELGNTEMADMLNSMSEINESSKNISKIIKVIDDIAFQTNLLALNAAVEAARAGEHGKGFAVVAEEVRALAGRSKDAAKETTELIEQSIAKVNDGTKIANNTAEALSKIVESVDSVSDIIIQIEASTKEQASSISLVNEGVTQISDVIQQNSATSEESAASAQELSSQAEMLKSMATGFKLKQEGRR